MDLKVGMHPVGGTPGIVRVFPSRIPRTEHCEMPLNIAIFFDGTGNNKDDDDGGKSAGSQLARRKQSNVARLHASFPDKPGQGYYRIYVEGLGTPCRAIGEDASSALGSAVAKGGEGRIHLALLMLLNTLVRAASPGQLATVFDADTIKALCRNGSRVPMPSNAALALGGMVPNLSSGNDGWSALAGPTDAAALAKVHRSTVGGLLMDGLSTNRERATSFYQVQMRRIAQIMAQATRPKPVEVLLEVYGFSRGSAQARVFCAWLCELAANGELCGLPLTIRFVGLFDTVASVGVPSAPASTYNLTNGHMAWAQPQWLRMPAAVKNCLHLVAMHENRAAFPVELLRTGSGLPANCQEFAFPGMHSDTGGGYEPDEQGRGTVNGSLDERDSEKLSQVSLSIMLRAAQAAGSPMDTSNVVTGSTTTAYNSFLVHDKIKAAYENFHRACGSEPRQMANWLMTYLAWRYQVRERYTQLPWRKRANATDIDMLEGANALLRNDIAALDNTDNIWKQTFWVAKVAASPWGLFMRNDLGTVRTLAPEAREVLQRMRAYPVVSDAEALLFGTYVHDSVAGFRPWDELNKAVHVELVSPYLRLEGYLRYRRFWTGSNQALALAVEPPDPDSYEEKLKAMQLQINMKGYGLQDVFPQGGWR